jgi:hypothetical protein
LEGNDEALWEIQDRYRISVTALSGMAEAEATLVSAGSRFYDGSTNSQKGTQSSTELQ